MEDSIYQLDVETKCARIPHKHCFMGCHLGQNTTMYNKEKIK